MRKIDEPILNLNQEPSSLFSVIKSYISLTKPRIIELLLVTTVPGGGTVHRQEGEDHPT